MYQGVLYILKARKSRAIRGYGTVNYNELRYNQTL